MSSNKKPLALIILDGWGHREDSRDNAIANAHTPTWDRLWQNQPKTLISGSGIAVGLPKGQMGNSEVGHMSLGSGRVIHQSISRIDNAIKDGSFDKNSSYTKAIDDALANDKAVHILGLLSAGGVHSHENHIHAMVKMAAKKGCKKIYVHAFLDGRDTPPRSAEKSIQSLEQLFTQLNCGRLATLVGRYYAMDRDKRWDRVELAYKLLVEASSEFTTNTGVEALQQAYARDENDEFVSASQIIPNGASPAAIADGDAVIFMNFRADRARELSQAFVDKTFDGFDRGQCLALSNFVMTTKYADSIAGLVAFPAETMQNGLPEYLSKLNKTQLRIAETEKYAHVTFFFSGGHEALYTGEDRILIDSPDVATYDLKPEMSAPELTEKLCTAIRSQKYDVIICNYANGDMVGHTGNYNAAVMAAQTIDNCLEEVSQAILDADGQCLITADHGNCEQMLDYDSGQAHTQHTTELVPLIYVGSKNVELTDGGKLADVAPSMLSLMELEKPEEMTGQSLVKLK